jgi:hypothetical protein
MGGQLPRDKDGKVWNPATEKLSPEQIALLREIHEKYGNPTHSPIRFVVHGGDGVLTFDIELPWPEQKK